jgi:hypothetical protein
MISIEFESIFYADETEVDVKVYGTYQPDEPDVGVQEFAEIEEVHFVFGIGKDQKIFELPISMFGEKTIEAWLEVAILKSRALKKNTYYGA